MSIVLVMGQKCGDSQHVWGTKLVAVMQLSYADGADGSTPGRSVRCRAGVASGRLVGWQLMYTSVGLSMLGLRSA